MSCANTHPQLDPGKRAHPCPRAQLDHLVQGLSFGQLVQALCFVGVALQQSPTAAQRQWYELLLAEVLRRSA